MSDKNTGNSNKSVPFKI